MLEDQNHYAWTHFHPIMGVTLRHFSEDLYELVSEKDPKIEKAQFVFQNFPHLTECPTKDLFSKHPTRSNLWRFRGRKDDITVLSGGRNVDPDLMEGSIAAHPKVKAALLHGTGKTKVSLLIEATKPPTNARERDALMEEIWPSVEKANEIMSTPGRVHKELILFTTQEKPFPRAGKGSVQRAMTSDIYKQELDELYESAEKVLVGG